MRVPILDTGRSAWEVQGKALATPTRARKATTDLRCRHDISFHAPDPKRVDGRNV